MYRQMVLIRRFEERAGQLYGMGQIGGFCHLYIGQEACVAGAVTALEKGDKWITAYRDHAHPLALGTSPGAVMAEMFAKSTGCSKGKGGSMHFFAPDKNYWGGLGIVGGQTPLGLAHVMGTGHHYGPAPWVSDLARPEWNPVYYHRADSAGIGFDRTQTGSNALAQYAPDVAKCLLLGHATW